MKLTRAFLAATSAFFWLRVLLPGILMAVLLGLGSMAGAGDIKIPYVLFLRQLCVQRQKYLTDSGLRRTTKDLCGPYAARPGYRTR